MQKDRVNKTICRSTEERNRKEQGNRNTENTELRTGTDGPTRAGDKISGDPATRGCFENVFSVTFLSARGRPARGGFIRQTGARCGVKPTKENEYGKVS
jgi:hypothetical protein